MDKFYALVGIAIGIGLLKYTVPILNFFGRDPSAEHWLGHGGTYRFIKLFASAVIIFSLMYLLGYFS